MVEYLNDFDGIIALNESLAFNFVFKHGFLLIGFEELLIDDFDADEFGILSVDSNVGITGHTATEFLLE